MPLSLDFPEIANAFRQFLLLPVRPIAHSFEQISRWLDKRVKSADLLEQASRDFPVVRFRDEAEMLWLDSIQHGALAPDEPPSTFGEQVHRAGRRFVQGVSRVKEAAQEDLILPNLFGTFEQALAAISASVERFARPPGEMTQELFNSPEARTASDLFGEAALAWRSIAGSTYQLTGFATQVGQAFGLPKPPSPEPSDPHQLSDPLERYSRLLVAGLLVLPTLPVFVSSVWRSLTVVVKFVIVNVFASIEARIFGLRRRVIDLFYVDLRSALRPALSLAVAAHLVLTVNLRFFARFTYYYGALLLLQLDTFLTDLADFFNKYIDQINAILKLINDILQFDLSPYISAVLAVAFGPLIGWAITKLMPTITVDSLITAGTDLARAATRAALTTFAEAVDLAVSTSPVIPKRIRDRVAAVPKLIWNALRPPRSYPDETRKPVWPPGYTFPNLYDTIFRSGLPGLRQAFSDLATELPKSTRDIIDAGAAAVDVLGDEFARQAERAAEMGSTQRYQRLADDAARQAQRAFGPDVQELRDRIARRPPDLVAQRFEDWLVTAGFELVAQAIPAYLQQMRIFWRDQKQGGAKLTVRLDVTSPHILARRAKLACVTMKQLMISAPGRALDDDLVSEVAAQFQSAIQQAYSTGQRRLEVFAVTEVG